MLYSLVKPLLFSVDPELAHDVSLEMLQQFHRLLPATRIDSPRRVMGLDFPNPVGLAAGLDKNGDYLDGLSRLGFGFIEVGSVTPRAQPGNPQPRIFRLNRYRSLINRMGFNNHGVDYLVGRVADRPRDFILGINIGKNLDTPVAQALDDYRLGLAGVYAHADYVAINISSPNTPGLRDLQNEEALGQLLAGIDDERSRLEQEYGYRRPLALKLAPDLDDRAIPAISDLLREYAIDGLIATNTTLARDAVAGHRHAAQNGGLSGRVLQARSRDLLAAFHAELGDEIPIISVGGIDSVAEAERRFELGASLIQLYTGLIFEGPGLVRSIGRALADRADKAET